MENFNFAVTEEGKLIALFESIYEANELAKHLSSKGGKNVLVVTRASHPELFDEENCNTNEEPKIFAIEQKTLFPASHGEISKKNDRLDNKVRMELLPMDALEAVAKIYTFGAEKYGEGTWRQLPDGSERYRAALLRHMTAECKGEELDPESGLPHVFHEAWNAIARVAIYLDKHK